MQILTNASIPATIQANLARMKEEPTLFVDTKVDVAFSIRKQVTLPERISLRESAFTDESSQIIDVGAKKATDAGERPLLIEEKAYQTPGLLPSSDLPRTGSQVDNIVRLVPSRKSMHERLQSHEIRFYENRDWRVFALGNERLPFAAVYVTPTTCTLARRGKVNFSNLHTEALENLPSCLTNRPYRFDSVTVSLISSANTLAQFEL